MGDYMINNIYYYYNMYPENICEKNKDFFFNYKEEKYAFVIFNRSLDETQSLYDLNIEMGKYNFLNHEFIININNKLITFIDDIPYILMKIFVNQKAKFNLYDVISINMYDLKIKDIKTLDRSSWTNLWSAKIDYFEYQISQVGKKYPILCQYLSYYIGLAENAISYVSNTFTEFKDIEKDNLGVTHKRIKVSDTMYDLYNPLSFVIDYKIRDFAEYIKVNFFAGIDVWPEIDYYFRNFYISLFSRRLLYARLLFPSYFFDVYEDIIDENTKEEKILKVIYKCNQYEKFLMDFYNLINNYNNIPQLDWLRKKL